ncbi:ORF15 [Psittacine aviadenovirus B]|uniref:ORF15 n=1 Tax=psittacine adenovirus 4 TaxID=2773287 RepID=A0A1P8SW83_9ADEN|nr:ORF15 [Psittacine aviadenovirus B]APY28365.1 ORF15 [psittacine adenovirus 4]
MQAGLPVDEEMEDELERIIIEGEARGDGVEMLEFHPVQLMCLETHEIELRRCLCHRYDLQDPGMNVHTTVMSFLSARFRAALSGDPAIPGVYFVRSWSCSMFYRFCPLFLDRRVCDGARFVEGMLIHVKDTDVNAFLRIIAQLCEVGVIPCHYLRRVDGDSKPGTLILYSTTWMGDCVNMLCDWQAKRAAELFNVQ